MWLGGSRLLVSHGQGTTSYDLASGLQELLEIQTIFFAPHPSRNEVAVIGRGLGLDIYDTVSWTLLRTFPRPQNVFDACWIDDDGLLIADSLGLAIVGTKRAGLPPFSQSPDHFAFAVTSAANGMFAGGENTVVIIVEPSGRQLRLEQQFAHVKALAFADDGAFLASRDAGGDVTVWRTTDWQLVHAWEAGIADFYSIRFHPTKPLLAVLEDDSIVIYRVSDSLPVQTRSVHYTTAKIALVGDSGVGKTGLGWHLAHGDFRGDHPSTHGEQFWIVERLSARREDGTECEAVIWDLAGQPDYRLIHSLFIDDADVALVVFDPTNRQEPLKGVEFWLRALSSAKERPCKTVLVGGRMDRGSGVYTNEEIDAFAKKWSISGGYVSTSALKGEGIEELLARVVKLIDWDKRIATVTTETFKTIKDHVLAIKEKRSSAAVLVTPAELQTSLQQQTSTQYELNDIVAATQHLANHGYVRHLRDSTGNRFILLAPDLLNNLAASIVLEARRNPKGLGALDERKFLSGSYNFPELSQLQAHEQEILLDAAAILFIEHNVCFRETLGRETFLIFPSLINQNRPPIEDVPIAEGTAYTVSGATENVYASLVVLLGYTNTFTRTNQWRNHAQYEMGPRELCGFRLSEEREGEIDLILYFGRDAAASTKQLFQGLFEKFLLLRDVAVRAFPAVSCPKCSYAQPRAEVMKRQRNDDKTMFCTECGKKVQLPPAVLTTPTRDAAPETLDREQQIVRKRTQFEKALTWLKGYLRDRNAERPPTCFISYAWGDAAHERWTERQLATDLRNAGIEVLFDRWHNTPGTSITRYIEQISKADFVVLVGTKRLKKKYDSKKADAVVEAELRLINTRLRKQSERERVLPLLLDGDAKTSFPPLAEDSVYVDFRNADSYFESVFDVLLKLYEIPFDDPAMRDLRDAIRGADLKR